MENTFDKEYHWFSMVIWSIGIALLVLFIRIFEPYLNEYDWLSAVMHVCLIMLWGFVAAFFSKKT